MEHNMKDMTSGTPWKLMLSFCLPALIGLLLQQLYNLADMVIVGQFAGELPLSAIGTTVPLTTVFLGLAVGFSSGATVVVAQLFGAGSHFRMRNSAFSSMLLMLAMGLVSMLAGYLITYPVLKYPLAVPEEILGMATDYFHVYAMGLVFQYGYNIITAILRGVGDSKATMYFLMVAAVLNIVLDIWFVAGLNMGVKGAALATDISQAGSFAAAYIYMHSRYKAFRFSKGDGLRFRFKYAKKTLEIGLPMAIQQTLVALGFLGIQRAVNSFGTSMTAAYALCQRMETFILMPGSALQMTMATYTGQNLGAGREDRVTYGEKHLVILTLVMTLCVSIPFYLCAGPLAHLFGLSGASYAYGVESVHVMCFTMLILAPYFATFGLFQGAGDGFAATITAMCALATRVLVVYLFYRTAFFSYHILWWNTAFGFTVGNIIVWTHFFRGKWKNKARNVVEL